MIQFLLIITQNPDAIQETFDKFDYIKNTNLWDDKKP